MDVGKLLYAAGVLFLTQFLPGCSSDADGNPSRQGITGIEEPIVVELVGASEVPPVASSATGTGTLNINRQTGQITGSVTFSGLSSAFTAAHIHTGFAGASGPAVIPLSPNAANPNQLDIPTTTLPADQLATLLAGGMYLNVHSANFPDGEIRGQIVPDGVTLIPAVLSGAFEVPPVETAGSGIGYLTVDTNSGELVANIQTFNLPSANAAHIHQAFAGVNGGVIVPLTQDAATPGRWGAESTLTGAQLAALLAGELYFNVHTPANPEGEIRGQIAPDGIAVVRTSLSGDFEVPPVTTAGAGIGYATVNTASGGVVANIRVSNLPTANAAHIHQAFAGLAGGVIVPLSQNAITPELWEASATLSPEQLAAFESGELYFNVHTPANPEGEIRGQLAPGAIAVVRSVLNGDFEVPPVATTGSGIGYATVNAGSGNVVANIRVSGLPTASAAHIHQAFAGLVGDVIVPLQQDATTPELWQASATLTPNQLVAFGLGGLYFNVHTPANPNGEIRGQILPPGITVVRTLLDGAQEVPPVATAATGIGYSTVQTSTGAVTANIRTTNIVNQTAAHIHQAPAGSNGGVILPLQQPDAVGSPELWAGAGIFTADQLAAYLADGTYLNVHTQANPNGEIRGQINVP